MSVRRRRSDAPEFDMTNLRAAKLPSKLPRGRVPLAFTHRCYVIALWFLLGLLSGMAISAARAGDPQWNTGDKVLFGSYVALNVIDAAQSDKGIRSGQYIETNPVYGERPSTVRILFTKTVFTGGLWWLADRLPDYRRAILLIGNAVEISVVAHNASIGMRLGF